MLAVCAKATQVSVTSEGGSPLARVRRGNMSLSNFLFRLLFPKQWEHMGHLVDDVIRLERKESTKTTTGSDCRTVYLEKTNEWP